MAKGWTVQVKTHDRGFRCDRVRQQLFDVAIEDRDKAVEAVRQPRLGRWPDAQVEATEPSSITGFLPQPRPGQIAAGRARVVSRETEHCSVVCGHSASLTAAAWPSHACQPPIAGTAPPTAPRWRPPRSAAVAHQVERVEAEGRECRVATA